MYITDIMESLSKNYIETIANSSGYFNFSGKDFGSDLHISRANLIRRGTYNRLLASGRQVHIQLKSVLEHNIQETTTGISYNLETKNFDDLIDRQKELGTTIPLILVVFIFPTNQKDWVALTKEELTIRKRAYWYYPEKDTNYTSNKTSQVIKIPKSNMIDADFFPMIFNYFN